MTTAADGTSTSTTTATGNGNAANTSLTGAAAVAAAETKTGETTAASTASTDGDKTGETKTGEKTGETKTGEKTTEVKPVEYKDFTMPEGFKADDARIATFKGVAGKFGITQEAAQELINTFAPQLKEASESPYKAWQDTNTEWQGKTKADPEYGGAKFDENLGLVAGMIDRLGGKEAKALRDALDYTGAGNHPEVTRFLVRAAKALSEGGPTGAGGSVNVDGKGGSKSAADVLYPTQSTKLGNQQQ